MKISFSQVCRDYLALRGESPDLLPLLEEGEEGSVLTLTDELRVRIQQLAEEAEAAFPRLAHDELRKAACPVHPESTGCLRIRLPNDYLKLHTLRMSDWNEPVTETEPDGSLRGTLGRNAPKWMACRHNPMVREERDVDGLFLRVYGSTAEETETELIYVARPYFDGEYLTISRAAYRELLKP